MNRFLGLFFFFTARCFSQTAEGPEDGLKEQRERIENFIGPRAYPNTTFDQSILYREWTKANAINNNARTAAPAGNWSLMGPTQSVGHFGLGRVNCIRFDPNNANIIWLGTPDGGLWKSSNGGSSWNEVVPFLSNVGVSDIAINPIHPDTMYAATGDKYGYINNNAGDFWGGSYSAGILRSIDGGNTWDTTGMDFQQFSEFMIERLIISPSNANLLLAATSNGIYRSKDAGASWDKVFHGAFDGVEFNPANPSIVYAAVNSSFFRSTNAGLTWSVKKSVTAGANNRSSIAVSPAQSQLVYFLGGDLNLYVSSDSGVTFIQTKSSPNSVASFYGYYDEALTVSALNANTVVCGGMNMAESIDRGNTWTSIGNSYTGYNGYVHVDNHDLKFKPGSSDTLFSANDGGIYVSGDAGTTWNDMNNGLSISQIYRISNSAGNPGYVYMGVQDNSTFSLDGGAWGWHIGGDGMECIIDYTDSTTVYASYQYGNIEKSTDGGNSFTPLTVVNYGSMGYWDTPYIMNPTNHMSLYAGFSDVYKTMDGGNTWNQISYGLGGDTTYLDLETLAIAPSDSLFLYAATLNVIYMTSDEGSTWNNITGGLPQAAITGITVSNTNPQSVWVSLSGYLAGNKVFHSIDGGQTWINVSGSLPNIPADCIVYQNGSPDGIYVGTDFGIYYTNSTMNDWLTFNNGFPNVIVDDLKIQYGANKIRAATYGRGLWESDLYIPPTGIEKLDELNSLKVSLYPNPAQGSATLLLNSNSTGIAHLELFNASGARVFEGMAGLNQQYQLNLSGISGGVYDLRASLGSEVRNEKVAVCK